MVVAVLFLILAFTLVATSYTHLSMERRLTNREHARNLAESALSLAVQQLLVDPEYGTPPALDEATLSIERGDRTRALVSFDPERSEVPFSTNNLQGDSAVPGWSDRAVPAQAAHLVAVGERSGVTVLMEALLHLPRFPFAIACSGPFVSEGKLLVGSLEWAEDLAAGVDNLDPEQLDPGHLASNAGGSEALKVGPEALITGDLRASGGVELAPTATVFGEVQAYQDPLKLPVIRVTDYDPVKLGKKEVQHLSSRFLQSPVLGGYLRSDGDLFIQGGAVLEGAVLYVDGDLSVDGALTGQGALFVTGDTQLLGGGALQSDNVAALVGGGDVLLQGNGQSGTYFQGLVYTEGNFVARDLTLVGVFLANGPEGSGSFTTRDVTVVGLSEYNRIDISLNSKTVGFYFDQTDGSFVGLDPHNTKSQAHKPLKLIVAHHKDGYLVRDSQGLVQMGGLQTADDVVEAFHALLDDLVPEYEPKNDQQLYALVEAHCQQEGKPGKSSKSDELFTLDLNRFLSLADRARVLYWRELGGGAPISE